MQSIFATWMSTCRFTFEAQQVIATRLLRSARCDAAASVEATRMVNEKIAALVEAHAAAGIALVRGRSPEAAVAEFVKPYVKRVRANHRRLHGRAGRAA